LPNDTHSEFGEGKKKTFLSLWGALVCLLDDSSSNDLAAKIFCVFKSKKTGRCEVVFVHIRNDGEMCVMSLGRFVCACLDDGAFK